MELSQLDKLEHYLRSQVALYEEQNIQVQTTHRRAAATSSSAHTAQALFAEECSQLTHGLIMELDNSAGRLLEETVPRLRCASA